MRNIPGRKSLTSGLILLSFVLAIVAGGSAASAQTQYITATPSYINLGMTTAVAVTAPAAGTYTVAVQKPGGQLITLTDTFTAAGQVHYYLFGNLVSGFNATVDQVGTYNIFLEQGTQVVGSNSFLATNSIKITFNMLIAGLCVVVPGGTRGQEMLAQFHVTYASNGATVMNFNNTAAKVTYTLPDGTVASARLHANSSTTWLQPWYQGHVWPTWNSSWVGNYYPSVNASDQYGNVGTFRYSGYPVPIAPATLNTAISMSDAKTGQLVTGLYNGAALVVTANIQYLQTPDPVAGFNGPLDTAVRGGVVTAVVGWGPYNATSGTFGSKTLPGGFIANVPMTYSTATKVWSGPLNIGTLPTLVNASAYTIYVTSHDKASPPNTGSAALNVPLATLQTSTQVTTTTATSTTTAVSTTTALSTTTATSTTTTLSTTTATSVNVVTSTRTAVSTTVQTNTVTPFWAYAVLGVLLVVIGIPIGYAISRSVARMQQAPPR